MTGSEDFGMKFRDKLASLIPLLIAPMYVSVSFAPVINEIGIVSPSVFTVIGFAVLVLERKAGFINARASR